MKRGIKHRNRPVTDADIRRIQNAYYALLNARDDLHTAGAHCSATRVRSALASCRGALNNARQQHQKALRELTGRLN